MASKIQSLAYLVAQSTDLDRWRSYGEQMLGMQVLDAPDGGLFLKMDERSFRMLVVPGAEDRYLVSGWECANAGHFASVRGALEAAGVAVETLDPASRQVTELLAFTDPAGNRHELSHTPTGARADFVSPIGVPGFVTGEQGLGHTVLPALPFDETLAFFTDVLGFGLSDVFDFQPAPDAPVMRLRFLHAAGGRHHSLALAEMPHPAGCVHAMVEVPSMTEVGKAYDRLDAQGVKLMATLGQHENDKMTSFYMLTPSGFALEYGWGGISVDVDGHQTTHTERVSIWGHDFSVGFS